MSNRRNLLALAKNSLRKLRTVRHPDVLKFIDVVETETTIYVVTERIQPLGVALAAWEGRAAGSKEEWLIWGLHRIAVRIPHYDNFLREMGAKLNDHLDCSCIC